MTQRLRALIPALAAVMTIALQGPAYADPPSWTPANGAREQDEKRGHGKHERKEERRDDRPYYGDDRHYEGRHGYHGYGGDDWNDDYGVVRGGRCDTNAVLGVTGAVTGAIIGNRTAQPENRGIATVIGAIAGGIIGSAVGDAIDDNDRACMGQSLELGRIGRPVVWVNPRSRIAWRIVPLRDVSRTCREFEVRRNYRGRHTRERVVACRRDRGYWEFGGR